MSEILELKEGHIDEPAERWAPEDGDANTLVGWLDSVEFRDIDGAQTRVAYIRTGGESLRAVVFDSMLRVMWSEEEPTPGDRIAIQHSELASSDTPIYRLGVHREEPLLK